MTTAHDHQTVPEVGFYDWLNDVIHSTVGLPIMVVVIFVLAVVSESLGAAIRRLKLRPVCWIRSRSLTIILHNLLSTLAHTGRVTLMFLLMVVFMALDPWLCTAAILGSSLGHLLFNWTFAFDSDAPDKEELLRTQR